MAAPPDPMPGETPAAELLDPVETVEGAAVAVGNLTAPYGFARVVPATPPVVAVVCAAAAPASTIKKSNAM